MSGPQETSPRGGADRVQGGTPLPIGTLLGDFEIRGVVGEGGFGIVYEALDRTLQRRIAIKEYMPGALADRKSDCSVVVRSKQHEPTFRAGMRSFINEARMLAAFDHPALLKVYSFWEQNGTAYMAMPLYEGRTLKSLLREAPRPSEAWLKALFAPLLDALASLHRSECYHRDVAADNIMILANGAPMLLDFGAARRIIGNMQQDVTVVLKPGYAPIEQYADDPSMKQGPWTDVYAVAAVLCLAITGKPPPTPVTRIVTDTMKPLRGSTTEYSDQFLAGIDRGLAVRPENRPQSIAEFRDALGIPAEGPSGFPTRWSSPPLSPPKSSGAPPSVPETPKPGISPPATGPAVTIDALIGQDPAPTGLDAPADDTEATRSRQRNPNPQSRTATLSGSPPPRSATTAAAPAPGRRDDKTPGAASPGASPRSWMRVPSKPVLSLFALAALILIGAAFWLRGKSESPGSSAVAVAPAEKPSPATPAAAPSLPVPIAPPESGSRPPESLPRVGSVPEPTPPAPVPRSPQAVPQADSRPPIAATPTEPSAPAVATGKIRFSIRPWGEVLIDGKSRGVSPPLKEISIAEGSHKIEIRNPGFPGYTGSVVVKAGGSVSISHSFK